MFNEWPNSRYGTIGKETFLKILVGGMISKYANVFDANVYVINFCTLLNKT